MERTTVSHGEQGGGKPECDEENGIVPVEDNGCPGETVQYPHENAQGNRRRWVLA
ncbi:MAG: hypothetical protein LBE10_01790 [Treponema sp.]|nr:hypothetical protein [Treponema sp.]